MVAYTVSLPRPAAVPDVRQAVVEKQAALLVAAAVRVEQPAVVAGAADVRRVAVQAARLMVAAIRIALPAAQPDVWRVAMTELAL